MKKYLLILFALLGVVYGQQANLPTGTKPYSSNLFLALDGTIWTGKPGNYTNIGSKRYVDSLINLGYKKTQVDSIALDVYNRARNRVNHTGTQAISTVSGLQAALEGKEYLSNKATSLTAPNDTKYPTTKAVADAISAIPAPNYPVTSVNGKTGAVVLNKGDVGLGNVDNTSDLAKPVSTATQAALNSKINNSEKGAANGVATLDGAMKIPMSQVPDALIGSVNYQGNWNPSTNTPTLPTTPGGSTKGHYYIASTSGTWNGTAYENGDWIISNGSVWGKVDNNNKVVSVNGKQGAVMIGIGDISGLQGFLDGKANTSGNNATGALQTTISNSHTHSNKAILDATTASYLAAEKTKLAGIEAGAEVNVNADWNATTGDAVILNKPTTLPPSAHTHPISEVTGLQSALDGKANNTVSITGTGALTGGGNLTANRTIDLSTVSANKLENGNSAYIWGNHSTAGYWNIFNAPTYRNTIGIDLNDFTMGDYSLNGSSPLNRPSSNLTFASVTTVNQYGNNNDDLLQINWPFRNQGRFSIRNKNNLGNWTPWQQYWHDGDFSQADINKWNGYATNFVDLTSDQNINGNKRFLAGLTIGGANQGIVVSTGGLMSPNSATRVDAGMYGLYNSERLGHVWSNGTGFKILPDGSDFGSAYGMVYGYRSGASGNQNIPWINSSHQIMFVGNGTPQASISLSTGDINTSGSIAANGAGAFTSNVSINAASGTFRNLSFRTNGVNRWIISTNDNAESGSNTGSDFSIYRYADNGSYLAQALGINRSTGDVSIGSSMGVGGNITASGGNSTQWNAAFSWGDHAGKYLPLNTTRNPAVDLDTLRISGVRGGGTTTVNRPLGSYQYSPYLTLQSLTDRFAQIWVDSYTGTDTGGSIYLRGGTSTAWGIWKRMWHSSDFTQADINNWNTAFSWGNHAGLYRPVSWVPSWSDVTGKPTTFTPSAHTHNASDINAGTLAIARIPTGTTGSTVALGSHTHSLQAITTGAGNNVTTNGLAVQSASGEYVTEVMTSGFRVKRNDGIVTNFAYDGLSNSAVLTAGGSNFTLAPESGLLAGARFNTRASGSDAVNPTDFVTKQQVLPLATQGTGIVRAIEAIDAGIFSNNATAAEFLRYGTTSNEYTLPVPAGTLGSAKWFMRFKGGISVNQTANATGRSLFIEIALVQGASTVYIPLYYNSLYAVSNGQSRYSNFDITMSSRGGTELAYYTTLTTHGKNQIDNTADIFDQKGSVSGIDFSQSFNIKIRLTRTSASDLNLSVLPFTIEVSNL